MPMKVKTTTKDYFNYSPFILVVWAIFSIAFLPTIPVANGFGWDGVLYGKMALNFPAMMGKMDSYHAGRIFPSVMLHYLLVFFKIPLNLKTALVSFQIYYFIILILTSITWVKIMQRLKLAPITKWIGFIALFINYPVLNFYFYYPPLTDGTALLIGVVMLYCYLTTNNILLVAVVVLSFFTWPTAIIIGLLIFIYHNVENKFSLQQYSFKTQVPWLLLIWLPLIGAVLLIANLQSISTIILKYHINAPAVLTKHNKGLYYNWPAFFDSIILSAYFILIYWYILKNFDFINFLKSNFKSPILFKIIASILLIAILVYFKKSFYDPALPTVTVSQYASDFINLSARFPLQFAVCHIVYWGPIMLLLMLFFKEFINTLKQDNLPIFIGLLFTIIFSINAESRAITNFYPFILFVLLQVINKIEFKKPKIFIMIFAMVSVLLSKVWLVIKLPATTFPNYTVVDLDKFPYQWLFMNTGLWMNGQMFLLHAVVCIVLLGLFCWLMSKNKLTLSK